MFYIDLQKIILSGLLYLCQGVGFGHYHHHRICPIRKRYCNCQLIHFDSLLFYETKLCICRQNWIFQLGGDRDWHHQDRLVLLLWIICLQWLELSQLCHRRVAGSCQVKKHTPKKIVQFRKMYNWFAGIFPKPLPFPVLW